MTKQNKIFKSSLNYPNRSLTNLFSQVEEQNKVLHQIRKILPTQLAQHTRHCVIKNKKLIIYTDSAAWASQLRFYNKAILSKIAPFTRESIEILQIRIFTDSTIQLPNTEKSVNLPSAENIDIIYKQALDAPDDILNRALLKLSKTLKRLSE